MIKDLGIIKLKVNKILFTVEVYKDNNQVYYSLSRNKKGLINSSTPIKRKSEVMMNIYRDLQEAIGYEIRHEIEQINL